MLCIEDQLLFHKFSHEIKNPLTICSGYLEMYTNSNNLQKEKYIKIIQSEIKRSIGLINSYEQVDYYNEIINLKDLLSEIKETLDPLFKDNNGHLKINVPKNISVVGSSEKLKQVFINILKNSIESRDKENISVIIKSKKDLNRINIEILDNGKGMTKKQLELIEKEYYTTKKNGTGLGVPLIKEIIKNHNGFIRYQSKPFIGTKITIDLPVKK